MFEIVKYILKMLFLSEKTLIIEPYTFLKKCRQTYTIHTIYKSFELNA